MAKIEIYKDKSGKKYRIRMKGNDGGTLAASPISNSWETEAEASEQARKIQSELATADIVVVD